ncbi:MAG: hypothetical protein DHS20C14_06770 [Phycisphaeraceae bacterium]|nr:MAG: hypothetical protein DHS20C14_06770 [Phycisphaeraceae bacterium]
MAHIAYTVTATIPNTILADRYVAWLEGGHLAGVLAGGAFAARAVRLDGPEPPVRVQVRYTFPSREAFGRYEAEFAPALRAEGVELFGPDTGIVFERSVGAIIASVSA